MSYKILLLTANQRQGGRCPFYILQEKYLLKQILKPRKQSLEKSAYFDSLGLPLQISNLEKINMRVVAKY